MVRLAELATSILRFRSTDAVTIDRDFVFVSPGDGKEDLIGFIVVRGDDIIHERHKSLLYS